MRHTSALGLLPLLALLAGCTQYYAVPANPQWFAGETVAIETWDGRSLSATPTTVYGVPAWDVGEPMPLPAPAARSVTRSNVGKSFAKGLGYGALIGFTTGALIGLLSGDDSCQPSDHNTCVFVLSATDKALVIGFLFHLAGAGIGGGVGLLSARREVYEVPSYTHAPSAVPSLSLRPVRRGAAASLDWAF
jgi:hypothetical protein